ncbi:ATP-dependent DNA helicase Q5-like [Melanaphis sacchari]|uniref:ATP-dependent DNA helicase Q5 n=1 Tax=Melanaphis sacchari TaxID=742174 RepID=A0A2H8TLF0_9HEMI|nr:ATP-dependent DNA helicase Q5-like [Melanaphis sacchari]
MVLNSPELYNNNIPLTVPEDSVLNSLMYDFFSYRYFKNKEQRRMIIRMLKRDSDIILSLPKNCGRTMCFQLPMLITERKVSIVFVGLKSRIEGQMNRLRRGNHCVEFIDSSTNARGWTRIVNKIQRYCRMLSGKNIVLYMTPDIAQTVLFQKFVHYLVNQNQLGYLVVDESYHEDYWFLNSAREYRGLRKLKKKYENIPWIVAISNGNTNVIARIKTTLCLGARRNGLPRDEIPCFGLFNYTLVFRGFRQF